MAREAFWWSSVNMSKDVLKSDVDQDRRKLTVIYDGSCDFCMSIARHFSGLPAVCDIEWRAEVPQSENERRDMRFRVVDEAGIESYDTEARLLLLSFYPRYQLIGRLLSPKSLRGMVTFFFNCVSDYRYVVSKIVRLGARRNSQGESLCDGSGACGSGKKNNRTEP